MKVHFLKTKWSDMIVLEDSGKFALVDTGFEEQHEQLSTYLDALGAKNIEFILLTHFHRDHYGNIPSLIQERNVKTVYFKEYGGHDYSTAWGSVADEEYRQSERNKWQQMKEDIEKYSSLVMAETVKSIDFNGTELFLYATENCVQKIWEDEAVPETYHKNAYGENQNSLAVFFEVNGRTVFLGGDIMDSQAEHPLANYRNLQVAKQINRQIYLYKAPHHGTVHTACEETLAIYRPEIAIITNGMEWLDKYDSIANLKKANPGVEIFITEDKDVIIEME